MADEAAATATAATLQAAAADELALGQLLGVTVESVTDPVVDFQLRPSPPPGMPPLSPPPSPSLPPVQPQPTPPPPLPPPPISSPPPSPLLPPHAPGYHDPPSDPPLPPSPPPSPSPPPPAPSPPPPVYLLPTLPPPPLPPPLSPPPPSQPTELQEIQGESSSDVVGTVSEGTGNHVILVVVGALLAGMLALVLCYFRRVRQRYFRRLRLNGAPGSLDKTSPSIA